MMSPTESNRTEGAVRSELRTLARLAVPVALGQLAFMMLGFVDTLMLGHLSTEALAAASLANVWLLGTMMFVSGTLMGIEPVMSQAYGAGDGERCALAFQRGIVLALLLCPLLLWLWTLTEDVLLAFGQDPVLAREAAAYANVQLISIPFFMTSVAFRHYLQARGIVKPVMWVTLVANVWNALLNWVLIFGALGVPALELRGAGIATAITRILTLAVLVSVVLRFRLYAGAWTPWTRHALDLAGLRRILAIGIPIAIQVSTEMLAFQGSTLIAGRLGATVLAAHTVVMNMAAFTFMMPLGISIGAAIRVGNLIGAERAVDAQRSAWIAIAMGAGVMAMAALLFVSLRTVLPRMYTVDLEVIAIATSILPIAAAFQIFDGTQAVGCGVLRGMGRPVPAAIFNFVGYWLLALPVGGWFALRGGASLAGLWWGLAGGLAVVAFSLIAFLRVRGPRTAVALERGS